MDNFVKRLTLTHFRNNAPISESCERRRVDATPDAELNEPHKQQHGGSKMVYVSNGQVLDSRTRSPWSLSFLGDLFWGVVEFIGLFFQTLIQPDRSKDGNPSSMSRFSDGRGPPGR
ncbi:hypothetical protein AMELA_G00288200 [Ameiurus melas]|uniref:Selenoprotein K n=1 Tax=Ameiurus melas TaxID=219545 RepID=A0A7J5ZL63_AMEME|nr:hypothetical protein AMELA_G00288200 [Ameiurus melas]